MPCYTMPCFHCVGTALFKFPERREVTKKISFFLWKWTCHGVLTATKVLLQSSHGILLCSYGVLVGDCLHSHGASTVCLVLSQRSHCMHCAFMALTLHWLCVEDIRLHYSGNTYLHQLYVCCRKMPTARRSKSSMQTPRTSTAFIQQLLCTPAEFLWCCMRPYCTAMVALQQPHCALIRKPRDGVCFLHAKSAGCRSAFYAILTRCHCIAAAMVVIVLNHNTHLSVRHFSWTLWDHLKGVTALSMSILIKYDFVQFFVQN